MPIVKVNSREQVKKVSARVRVPAGLIFVILFCSGLVVAQVTAPISRPSPTSPPSADGTTKNQDNTPLTSFEEELKAKRAIRMAEKDHEENLKRAREIAEIGKALNYSLKNKSVLDRDSLKKLERLEKLTRKVRSEAGGGDEEVEIEDRPADLHSTLAQIAEASESLSKNVQDTPRQVVSASVIGKANVLLELIKLVRNFASP